MNLYLPYLANGKQRIKSGAGKKLTIKETRDILDAALSHDEAYVNLMGNNDKNFLDYYNETTGDLICWVESRENKL